jgi:hypothetical protein
VDKLKEGGVKRTVATEALAKLTAPGTIRRIGEGKRGSPYHYHNPMPESEKHSSALKNGVPDERKSRLDLTTVRSEEEAHILSSGTSTYMADEKKPGLAQ